jgi:hypothetical protein
MRFIAAIMGCALLSACAIQAPKYVAQPQSQSILKNGGLGHVSMGTFSAREPGLERLSIRGNPLTPTTGTFSGDIRQALESELRQAGLLGLDQQTTIGGTLVTNELNGRGLSKGYATIAMDFFVVRDGHEVWRGTKTVSNTWDSSFFGAKAIPAASQGYVESIGKLVAELVSDAGFQDALK